MTDLLNRIQQDLARDIRELTGAWTLDPAHTSIEFSVRHMMVATVRGRMSVRQGTLEIDPSGDPERSSVFVEVDTTTLDSGNADRDNHLRSPDFLDTDRYPTMTFRSTQVEDRGDGELAITGDLTVRDVTRPVTLYTEEGGIVQDPFGNLRMGFSAHATIDRKEFGLTWNAALEGGGAIVGDKVKVAIEAEFTRPIAAS